MQKLIKTSQCSRLQHTLTNCLLHLKPVWVDPLYLSCTHTEVAFQSENISDREVHYQTHTSEQFEVNRQFNVTLTLIQSRGH